MLPIALIRVQSAAKKKEGLLPFECIYVRPFLRRDLAIGLEALGLTHYVTQLSAFQQALAELWEKTPDPASEFSKPLFEPGTEVLIKTLGAHASSPSGKSLTRLFFLLPQLSKYQELIHGYSTLELGGGALTRIKWCHFMSLLSMLWLCTFQMGLITYVSLLLLTPEILCLSFAPQDNAFLSWAHFYAALHNQSNCWVCGALPSASVEVFPWWTSLLQGKDFPQVCNYLWQQSHGMPLLHWWHLPTLEWSGATLCTLIMDITWLLILIIHCLGLITILLHIRHISLDLIVFYLTLITYGMRLYG